MACPIATSEPDYFDRLDKNKLLKRLTRRIEDLGYQVQLRPVA